MKTGVLEKPILALFLLLLISSCSIETPQNEMEGLPVWPLELIESVGTSVDEVVPLRTLLHVRDVQYPYNGYSANGEHFIRTGEDILFPTDVLVVLKDNKVMHVFLQRSPHGGCPIRWVGGWPWSETADFSGENYFDEGCYGSRWDIDGVWIMGPSPRNMDELPFEIKNGMLWVTGKILYGESHQ